MKNQALFSSKDKIKKSECRLLQFLFGALRVKIPACDFNYRNMTYVFCIIVLRKTHQRNNEMSL